MKDLIMQLRAKVLCFLFLCINLTLIGCAVPSYADLNNAYTSDQDNQRRDDAQLEVKLQDIIDASYPKSAKVLVLSDHFNILIVGQVDSQGTQKNIDALVKSQSMVKKSWDYTTIRENPKLYENTSLTKKAKTRLMAEQNIASDNLQAVAVENIVYVFGTIKADEQPNIDSAINGIGTIAEVIKVVNLTQVIPYGNI